MARNLPIFIGRPLGLVRRPLGVLRRYWRVHRELRSRRPRHLGLLGGLLAGAPSPLRDRPDEEIEGINRSSEEYFSRSENIDYWLNRPFSEPRSAPRALWRFSLLLSALRLSPGDRILDFGCGSGWTSGFLARLGAEVVGMDVAPAALEIAERAARELPRAARERLRFVRFDGRRIDAPDSGFDVIVVNDAFHHFPNPATILREFHRVLAPEGVFGFAEPGTGHHETDHARTERERGVLEEDVDIEQLYRSGREAGFVELELVVPPLAPEAFVLPMGRARNYLRGVPWHVPGDLFRLTMLEGPIGVFYKGPHVVTSRRPRHQLARIRPAQASLAPAAGDEIALGVRVKNEGDTTWLREGRRGVGYVRLGAHLLGGGRKMIVYDYGRAELPQNLACLDTAELTLKLRAPDHSGDYSIVLDMVNEGIGWFEASGSATAEVSLRVS